jgi:hypothetical protein
MKKASFAVCLMLILSALAWAQAAKPDFSGTWKLDPAKSDFGPAPVPDSLVSVVDHKEPKLVIKTTQVIQQGEFVNERNLTTDGKPNANKLKSPMGEQDITSTTNWDGSRLVTAYSMTIQGTALDFRDTWELSGDGKTLTILRSVKADQGDFTQSMVFNRQ